MPTLLLFFQRFCWYLGRWVKIRINYDIIFEAFWISSRKLGWKIMSLNFVRFFKLLSPVIDSLNLAAK